MSNPNHPQNAPENTGWSTKKKWIVGCGGCLGVVLLIVAGLVILAGMGINSVMQVSGNAVAAIFGPSYKPENYMAMGLPVNSHNVQNMALLIGKEKGDMIYAVQTELPAEQLAILRSGKLQQMQGLLKQMANQAIEDQGSQNSASGKLRSFRLDQVYNLGLAPNKIYTVCNATVAMEKRGQVGYMPTSIALIPEANNKLVILGTFDPNNHSSNPDTNFDGPQQELQKQTLKIIKDSELDDRISMSGSASPSAKPTTAGR